MTKKNYIAAAEMIRKQKLDDESRDNIVEFLSKMFADDNPRFNKKLFLEACKP